MNFFEAAWTSPAFLAGMMLGLVVSTIAMLVLSDKNEKVFIALSFGFLLMSAFRMAELYKTGRGDNSRYRQPAAYMREW